MSRKVLGRPRRRKTIPKPKKKPKTRAMTVPRRRVVRRTIQKSINRRVTKPNNITFHMFPKLKFTVLSTNTASGTVYIDTNKTVVVKKFNTKYNSFTTFEREVYWLTRFNKANVPWAPKIKYAVKPYLCLDYRGTRIKRSTLPRNWRTQARNIETGLRQHKCIHNDIKSEDILVLRNKLTLIDFGWASLAGDMRCGTKYLDGRRKPGHTYNSIIAVLSKLR